MIDTATQTPLDVTGERITVEVLGRKKPVATAREDGLEVWCKVLKAPALIEYERLMSVPGFRAGVLAVLAAESSAQAGRDRV
jgi:hypothetical protein